jgi:branched-chain amino acid transport system substrate-binding protein
VNFIQKAGDKDEKIHSNSPCGSDFAEFFSVCPKRKNRRPRGTHRYGCNLSYDSQRYQLAVEEINAGGILGKKIDYNSFDTQSNPGVAKGLADKAVDDGAYVVMGPVFSGSILVSMASTKRAEIPNFTGGEAGSRLPSREIPTVFRTSFTQSTAMPKIANYIKDTVKAKVVDVVYVNNDFGKGGRDLIIKALEARGIKVGADISSDPGQVDFSSVVIKAKQSNSDALFAYTNEEESARLLRELKKQGYNKPVIGETVLTSQKVIELAGDACKWCNCPRRFDG